MMLKKSAVITFIIFVIILHSCVTTQGEPPNQKPSETLSPPSPTQFVKPPTSLPTTDLHPQLRSSLTPTPMLTFIPTFTVTPVSTPTTIFNQTFIPTYTPAQSAMCPSGIPDQILVYDVIRLLEERVDPMPEPEVRKGIVEDALVNVLNTGATSFLYNALSIRGYGSHKFALEDLTNDGISELIIVDMGGGLLGKLYIFGCRNGEYSLLFTYASAWYPPWILDIRDLNRNGVSDLVVSETTCHYCTGIRVFEWNGSSFESMIRTWMIGPFTNELIPRDFAELPGYSFGHIADIDHNGFYEILLVGGKPSYLAGLWGIEGPYREQVVVYMWDGSNYVWHSQQFYAPDFRFQAIQDADDAAYAGDYSRALDLYQKAIYAKNLKSWNSEIWKELQEEKDRYPDLDDMPFNKFEYDQLSAYARYRMMILFVSRGWLQDAKKVNESMRDLYPPDNPGHPYVELANMFLSEYLKSQNLSLSCNVVASHAEQYPEILQPLGSYDHGLWTKHYSPKDICPY
jgi:hypothetical protein